MPKKTKKKVTEYFDVKIKGKGKTIKAEGAEVISDNVTKKDEGKENKILLGIFLTIVILMAVVLIFFYIASSLSHFVYRGVAFNIVKEGDLILYQTSFPVVYQDKNLSYNIYLRNDPRKIEKVPFNGNVVFNGNLVLNVSNDLNCDGKGVLAVANFLKLEIFRMNIFKNESLGCDPNGKYTFVNIESANESGIEQFGPACYNLNVNNCEVLDVTERFMIESFVKANEAIKGGDLGSSPVASPV